MAAPDVAADMPLWVQVASGAAVFAVTVGMSIRQWLKGAAGHPEPASKVVLERGTLADMRPFIDAAETMKDLANTARRIEAHMVEAAKEREDREDEARLAETVAEVVMARLEAKRRPRRRTVARE